MWPTIITTFGSAFKQWWEGRQRVKEAKVQAKVAKHEAEAKFQMRVAEIEATWDLVALRMSQYSTKDELIALVIFAPLIAAWFPGLRPHVLDWVDFIDKLPIWYQVVMFGIVAATFGLRWWFNKTSLKVGK